MTEQPNTPDQPEPMPDYPLDDAARDDDPSKDDQLPPPADEPAAGSRPTER
jgi:hypothetical protein